MSIWEHNTLGELCTLEIGGTPTRDNPLYWDSENTGSNYWVSIADLKTPEIMETEERITDLGVRHSNAKLFKKGTVLLSFKLTVGRVAIAGRDLYTNEAIAGLTSEKLDHHFLYYGLQHWNLLKDVDQAIKGITLNKRKLKKIDAHYPSDKKEQAKITEVLATIDRAIAQTKALIAKHQRIKTGLMQDLLTRGIAEHGQLRDPSTHRFKSTPLGMIPEEWDAAEIQTKLSNIIDYRGKTPSKTDSGTWLITARNVRDGYLSPEPKEFIATETYDEWMTRGIPSPGDVLFTTEAPMGNVARIPTGKVAVGQRILTLVANPAVLDSDFLFWLLQWETTKERLKLMTTGSTVTGIKQSVFRKIIMQFPKTDEQKLIASILNAANQKIEHIQLELSKLNRLKTGLMQDLLSGRVSVKVLMEG